MNSTERPESDELKKELDRAIQLLESSWGIIANVSEGDWERQSAEWQDAVKSWSNAFQDFLSPMTPKAAEAMQAIDEEWELRNDPR